MTIVVYTFSIKLLMSEATHETALSRCNIYSCFNFSTKSFISALSDDIEHSMQTSRFSVYIYIYIQIYIYIYIYSFFFFVQKHGTAMGPKKGNAV